MYVRHRAQSSGGPRRRFGIDRAVAERRRAVPWVVRAGGAGRRVDHADGDGLGGRQLHRPAAGAGLRPDCRLGGGRSRCRSDHRRVRHRELQLALGLRSPGPDRLRHPDRLGQNPRRPGGGASEVRRRRCAAVGCRPGDDRVRRAAVAVVGLGSAPDRRRAGRDLDNRQLRGGLPVLLTQYLVSSGLFFTVPLFLSIVLGLDAFDTGIRMLPLSLALIVVAPAVPRFAPHASPRRIARSACSSWREPRCCWPPCWARTLPMPRSSPCPSSCSAPNSACSPPSRAM